MKTTALTLSNKSLHRHNQAERLFNLARVHLLNGNPDKAKRFLRKGFAKRTWSVRYARKAMEQTLAMQIMEGGL